MEVPLDGPRIPRRARRQEDLGTFSRADLLPSQEPSGVPESHGGFAVHRPPRLFHATRRATIMTTSAGPVRSITLPPTADPSTAPTYGPLESTRHRPEIVSNPRPVAPETKFPRPCAGGDGQLPPCQRRGAQQPADLIDQVRASRAAQGLSLGVTDPTILVALRRTLVPSRSARDKLRWSSRP